MDATAATTSFDDLAGLGGDSVEAAPPAPKRPAFCPPSVKVGDMVWWYGAAKKSNRPAPLIVNDVEGNVISGHLFAKGKLPLPVNGIRHIDDPFFQSNTFVAVKDGAWDRKG